MQHPGRLAETCDRSVFGAPSAKKLQRRPIPVEDESDLSEAEEKSRAGDGQPDQKWVVEYLVQREGQRKTAALLGVNRKTVALALGRERLTGRMALAVQRFMAGLDDPDWERTTSLDRLEARVRQAIKAVDDLRRLVDDLTRRVEALEAAREMEVSISTLDRMIRRGEVEVRREGRRVYVRMEGPEYASDEELLRRALGREGKLQRRLLALDQQAQALERERDEAMHAASADRQAREELEEAYEKELAAHKRTRRLAVRLGIAVFVLLAVVGVLLWWFVLR